MTNPKPNRLGGIKFLILSGIAAGILALWNYFAGQALGQNNTSAYVPSGSNQTGIEGINMSALPTLADLIAVPSDGVKPVEGNQNSSTSSGLRSVSAATPAPTLSAPVVQSVVVSSGTVDSGSSTAPVTTTQSSR